MSVFIITETYTYEQHFYLVAKDKHDAVEEAKNTDFPDYIDLENASLAPGELLSTEAEKVETIRLRSIGGKIITLIPAYGIDENYYYGYRVRKTKVGTEISQYAKARWSLLE